MPKAVFKTIGYFLEYYVGGKFYGTTVIDEPDREEIGYYGIKHGVAEFDIQLDQKNKKITKGTPYFTRLYPLNGKRV